MSDQPGVEFVAPEDFTEHVDYLGDLVQEATEDNPDLRDKILRAIEDLVTNVDGGPWAECRVGWTSEVPDDLEGLD